MLSKDIYLGLMVALVVVVLSWWTDMCLTIGGGPAWLGAFHAMAACGAGLAGWLGWRSAYIWLRRDWFIPMAIAVTGGMCWSLGGIGTGLPWLGVLGGAVGLWAWMVAWRGIRVVHDWAHWCMLPMGCWYLSALGFSLLEILL